MVAGVALGGGCGLDMTPGEKELARDDRRP